MVSHSENNPQMVGFPHLVDLPPGILGPHQPAAMRTGLTIQHNGDVTWKNATKIWNETITKWLFIINGYPGSYPGSYQLLLPISIFFGIHHNQMACRWFTSQIHVYIYNSHRLHRKYSSQNNHIFGHIWTFWIGSTDKIVILIWKLPTILTWQKPSRECWKTTNFLQGIAPNPMDMMGSQLSEPIKHIPGWPFTGRESLDFSVAFLYEGLSEGSSPHPCTLKKGLGMNGTQDDPILNHLVGGFSLLKKTCSHNLKLDVGINHCQTKP